MDLLWRLARWHCCLATSNKSPKTGPGESLIVGKCKLHQNHLILPCSQHFSSSFTTMARKPRDNLQKNHINQQKAISALRDAVAEYKDCSVQEKVSICALALKYKLNKGTFRAHIDPNHISINVFNATKQSLSPTQEDVLIWWVIEMAN